MGSNSILNDNYFENISTKENAYWLGFLFADGSIVGNRIGLCLSSKDLYQIEKFKMAIGSNNPIKSRVRKCRNKLFDTSEFFVSSFKMVEDLKKKGCTEKKSLTIEFPQLDNEELYMAFLLGYYDGDGCCGTSVICSGSLFFLESIKDHFNIQYNPKLKINPYGKCYILSLGRKLLRKIFLNFDYGIDRKRFFKDLKLGVINRKYWSVKPIIPKRTRKYIECPFDKNELQSMVIEKSLKDIGIVKNVSFQVVKRWCENLNVMVPSSKQKNISKRKFSIGKEELKDLIMKYPMIKIGEMFKVSDNAIRKRARLLGILPQKYLKGINNEK